MSLYDVLGVPPHATPEEIKRAYKSLAGKLHPDKNPDNPEATANFQKLQRAYSVLSNPEKREHYNLTGSEDDSRSIPILAKELLAHLYTQHATLNAFEGMDYWPGVCVAIKDALTDCRDDLKKHKIAKANLKALIDNTAADTEILEALEGQFEVVEANLARAREGEATMALALELIREYSYTGQADECMPWDAPSINTIQWRTGI